MAKDVVPEVNYRKFAKICGGGRTQQNFKQQCDINFIVERAKKSGYLPDYGRVPRYEDVSAVPGYQESLELVMRVDQAFNALPAKVRERFANDPVRMVDYINNLTEENYEEAVKLGLIVPKKKAGIEPEGKSEEKTSVDTEIVTP